MKTLLLCPFGHADVVDVFPEEKLPGGGYRQGFGCRGCGRVFVQDTWVKDIRRRANPDRVAQRVMFGDGMHTEDGEWSGQGVVLVYAEDDAPPYDKPVPTGEAYHELYRQVVMGDPK